MNIVNQAALFCMDVIDDTKIYNVLSFAKTVNEDVYIKDTRNNQYIFSNLYKFYLTVRPKSRKKFINTYDAQAAVDDLYGAAEYMLLSEFIDTKKPMLVRHSCGSIYYVSINALFDKRRTNSSCVYCKTNSRGEDEIRKTLEAYGYNYVSQYTNPNCKDKRALPFDFAIFSPYDNITPLAMIEFDGEQHYEAVEAWGGEEKLYITMHHDSIKDYFCEHNNIPMLRISYKDFDKIEQLVLSFLSALKIPVILKAS